VIVLADDTAILINARTQEAAAAFRDHYPADWLNE
jgi:hypothetical protein